MDEEDQFLSQALSGISESEVITIFFPLWRRALVVDTRHDEGTGFLVRVMPQVSSMEERLLSIERLRPRLGKVRSILGIPWMKSVKTLREQGVANRLIERLADAGVPVEPAIISVNDAIEQLWQLERLAYIEMVRGQGYETIWTATS